MQAIVKQATPEDADGPDQRRWIRAGVVFLAASAVILGLTGRIAGEGLGLSVHYQVTYTNGTVSDLADVPATNEGILRVVRIARVDEGGKGYEVLSTGRRVMSQISQPRTFTRDMEWNGQTWVPRALPEDLVPPPTSEQVGALPQATLEAVARMEAILQSKRLRLAEWDQIVADAEATLHKARGTADESAATRAAEIARLARDDCRDTVDQLQGILAELRPDMPATVPAGQGRPNQPSPFDRPEGRVERFAAGQVPQCDLGVARPIDGKVVPPHRLQLWPLPPGQGRRTYQVMMAHGEAGPMGAFRYVAIADTDGDGQPDQIIAYSPLATADVAGDWTGWTFSTAQGRVFVGNAWEHPDACIFAKPLEGCEDNWRGLGTEVYVSGSPWGMPCHKCRRPYFSNIRVRVAEQNPD